MDLFQDRHKYLWASPGAGFFLEFGISGRVAVVFNWESIWKLSISNTHAHPHPHSTFYTLHVFVFVYLHE